MNPTPRVDEIRYIYVHPLDLGVLMHSDTEAFQVKGDVYMTDRHHKKPNVFRKTVRLLYDTDGTSWTLLRKHRAFNTATVHPYNLKLNKWWQRAFSTRKGAAQFAQKTQRRTTPGKKKHVTFGANSVKIFDRHSPVNAVSTRLSHRALPKRKAAIEAAKRTTHMLSP